MPVPSIDARLFSLPINEGAEAPDLSPDDARTLGGPGAGNRLIARGLTNDTDAGWIDFSNEGVARMDSWYNKASNIYDNVGWWQMPVMLFSYMDLDRARNSTANEASVARLLDDTRGKNYMTTDFVDDQSWWGLAAAQGYQLYGSTGHGAWLQAAITIFEDDMTQWSSQCGGGAVWKKSDPPASAKNTITNTLHIITGNQTYLDWSVKTYNWWASWGFDSTGKTWDTISLQCTEGGGTLERMTYNSGMILGGLVDLATATKNQTYLSTATLIANEAMTAFSNPNGVMQEYCDEGGCGGDTVVFKAVLSQGLGYLYRQTGSKQIHDFLAHNFEALAANGTNSSSVYASLWNGPFNTTLATPLTQVSGLGAVSAGVVAKLWGEAHSSSTTSAPVSRTSSAAYPSASNPTPTTGTESTPIESSSQLAPSDSATLPDSTTAPSSPDPATSSIPSSSPSSSTLPSSSSSNSTTFIILLSLLSLLLIAGTVGFYFFCQRRAKKKKGNTVDSTDDSASDSSGSDTDAKSDSSEEGSSDSSASSRSSSGSAGKGKKRKRGKV